jgi:hypothetical protein
LTGIPYDSDLEVVLRAAITKYDRCSWWNFVDRIALKSVIWQTFYEQQRRNHMMDREGL